MRVALKQIKTYLRLALVLFAGVTIFLVLVKNRSNTVEFWFFGLTDTSKPVNVVWLLVSTAAVTRATMWLVRLGVGLWREFRELKRLQSVEHAKKLQQKRAAELDEREKRFNEKMKKVLDENENEKAGE